MTTPRPPAPLPRRTRALLAVYRDAHAIPVAVEERIWTVVGAEHAPAPAYDPLAGAAAAGSTAASQRAASQRWLAWGAAMLAAAAVLVLAWQLGGSLGARRHASRTPDAAVMQGGGRSTHGHATPRAAAPTAAVPPSMATPAEPSPGSSTEAATSAGPTPSSPVDAPTRPRRAVRDAPAEPAPVDPASTSAASTLAAERELVARAWGALALGETARALEAAAEHARRFPAGLLAPERAAIDTIARCRRGDANGPRRATAFHRAHPRSPLAERVDEACGAPTKQ